ncbi:hypothetical protein I308_104704 [Cryptococcus tetragattii IND107]|uniref:Uncharacterized protein n=1 Tax=Cryptococcus tetragattii IND107 TaxID=1296105 RepID=A0ABR3BNC9_9TREE
MILTDCKLMREDMLNIGLSQLIKHQRTDSTSASIKAGKSHLWTQISQQSATYVTLPHVSQFSLSSRPVMY